MSGRLESEARPDVSREGEALPDPLEQFETIVDLDRRVEDALRATAADHLMRDALRDVGAPSVAARPAACIGTREVARAGPASRTGGEQFADRTPAPPTAESLDADLGQGVETSRVDQAQRKSQASQSSPLSQEAANPRPKLVPRSAEPELVGADPDELAWADDPSEASRRMLGAVVVAVLLCAAGVIFVPQWLERGAPDTVRSTEIADVDPIAYRAPKRRVGKPLPVAPPGTGALDDEPLPRILATTPPSSGPRLLAAAVAPPPPLRQDSTVANRPSTATAPAATGPATTGAAATAVSGPVNERPAAPPRPTAVDPRALGRVEPEFTTEDTLEQEGPRIVLRVLVDERGAPVRVMVKEGVPGTAGVSKAIDAILRTRYEAGRRQGKPIRAWLLETFDLP